MKLLTKQTDYAIRAVLHLAQRNGARTASREIAERERIPLQFLRRIVQTLVKDGVVTSKEGVAGGLTLARKAGRIRVLDMIRLFQGAVQLSECLFRKKVCHNRATCALRRRIARVERQVTREFERLTIAQLLKESKR